MANKKNEVAVNADGTPDFSGFVKEQINFPPYWNPEIGKKIYFTPMMVDDKNSNFIRFVCRAEMPIACQTGPADEAEDITIKKGEYFTVSDYKALPLANYFGHAVLVEVVNKRKFKGDDGTPRDLWVFDLTVSPETKRLLEAKREEVSKALSSGN